MNYPAYPDYTTTRWPEVGSIPFGWEARRLKFAVTLRNEKIEAEDVTLEYMGLEHIESWTGKRIDDETASSEGVATRFVKNDVLFGKLRPYLAKVYLAEKEGMATTEALVLMTEPALVPVFLKYLLLSEKFIDAVSGSTFGAKMPRANWETIGGLPVLLPSHDEQQQIAAFLDWKTGQIDALIAKKKELLEKLKERRLAVITQAVTKGLNPAAPLRDSGTPWLGQVPKHWNIPTLKMRYAVELGKMLDEKRITGDCLVPYLRNVDVQWGKINFDELPQMDIMEDELPRYTIRENDVLVCEGGEVGRAAVVGDQVGVVGFQKALHRLRSETEAEMPRFIFYTLLWAVNTGVFAVEGASTIAHLTADQLRRYHFPQPPLSEQENIVSYLDEKVGRVSQMIEKINDAIARLTEYRTALITAATIGKIDVRQVAIPSLA